VTVGGATMACRTATVVVANGRTQLYVDGEQVECPATVEVGVQPQRVYTPGDVVMVNVTEPVVCDDDDTETEEDPERALLVEKCAGGDKWKVMWFYSSKDRKDVTKTVGAPVLSTHTDTVRADCIGDIADVADVDPKAMLNYTTSRIEQHRNWRYLADVLLARAGGARPQWIPHDAFGPSVKSLCHKDGPDLCDLEAIFGMVRNLTRKRARPR